MTSPQDSEGPPRLRNSNFFRAAVIFYALAVMTPSRSPEGWLTVSTGFYCAAVFSIGIYSALHARRISGSNRALMFGCRALPALLPVCVLALRRIALMI
ncbi:hypothetical protein P6166_12130 [Stenotrophomonas sp. HITSZ_GD]|uniref:hypothetical protein n=1 Tax=Stenotrophomonas sp. HITSZ_GD TaxID=3037248 RepID=UPI00240E7CFD|nr:hypothetical protein [Stenotrophomonas sp. HITSZ_GD]MDG2526104.1 hypothetical protein [Stenotrophomonas sp. HITSZ_GD]